MPPVAATDAYPHPDAYGRVIAGIALIVGGRIVGRIGRRIIRVICAIICWKRIGSRLRRWRSNRQWGRRNNITSRQTCNQKSGAYT